MTVIKKYTGPQYKAERVITLVSWIIDLLLAGYFLSLAVNYYTLVYKFQLELPQRPNYYWPFIIFTVSALLSIVYWIYLLKKKQKKQEMRLSLFLSLTLLILPFLLFEFIGSYFVFGVYQFGKPAFLP